MKPLVDTTKPSVMGYDHLRNNLKREQMLEERYSEIDRENRILLQKMSDIMRHPTFSLPRSPSGPVSLNRDYRKGELVRITQENQAILRRIQRAQPMYNHIEWDEAHKRNTSYLRNSSEYPITLRMKKSHSVPGMLAPLDHEVVEESQQRLEQAMAEDRHRMEQHIEKGGAQDDDELKYVLKEGKRIGEDYFLVEMATDGRTLTVSAYHGDTQRSLELLVNERNHRKLYRETNGDYSALASRLRVEGDRLLLESDSGVSPYANQELQADEVVRAKTGAEALS